MGNFLFVQLLKCWLCNMQLGIIMENGAHSVDHCQLQTQKFSVYLIHSLSILLRRNGFAGIQKVEVVQTSSRPPNSDHDFFGASLTLGSALELLLGPVTEGLCQWSYKIHISLHITS